MSQKNLINLNHVDPVLVREYLLDHPDFFSRYPELLLSMQIPHQDRGTVSLVERQQMMLRERVGQLEEEITSLLSVAARNEEIYRFYSELLFDLLALDTLEAVQQELAARLRAQFRFTRVRLLSARSPGQFEQPELALILKRRLDERGYYLGRLPAAEARLLVGIETGSVALIGLGEPGRWQGLLAIASHDPSHFVPEMGTMLLDQLKQLLTFRLQQANRG
ncbi:DUF484 family protein [Ferrimonas marina]|uniref:DUF484 family protein n=1 Tax=Ferrimonas marina TaxID=299255 RepID=A0A1M5XRJ1_9GAMM|nr:DUF484 family protein [Ferrimonas marina]SHI02282.1 hypothetical protein SAMN02745129_3626 [Ferrimonas marina]